MKRAYLLLFSAFLMFSCKATPPQSFPSGKIIDLSHVYDAETIFWPTEEGFRLEKEQDGINEKGYYYASNKFCTPEHGGTHIDAPRHFSKEGDTVDQIPLEKLIGKSIVIDVTSKCESNADYEISPDDFQQWEAANGRIPDGTIVLLRTGYGKRWPDRKSYMGTDERGAEAVAKLHFPGLSPAGARWISENRSISAIGLDTPSIDYGQSTMFETHQTLYGKNIPAFENLANLDQLPVKDFTIVALPMKIKGGSGGPLRIVAILPESR